MQPREFLALADQLQAFQTIMSGALAKEAEDAKQALAKLKDANDLIGMEAQMKDREAIFEESKRKTQLELDAIKVELMAKEKQLNAQESDLDSKVANALNLQEKSRESVIKAEEVSNDLNAKIRAFEKSKAKAEQDLQQRTANIASEEARLAAIEAKLNSKIALLSA